MLVSLRCIANGFDMFFLLSCKRVIALQAQKKKKKKRKKDLDWQKWRRLPSKWTRLRTVTAERPRYLNRKWTERAEVSVKRCSSRRKEKKTTRETTDVKEKTRAATLCPVMRRFAYEIC